MKGGKFTVCTEKVFLVYSSDLEFQNDKNQPFTQKQKGYGGGSPLLHKDELSTLRCNKCQEQIYQRRNFRRRTQMKY